MQQQNKPGYEYISRKPTAQENLVTPPVAETERSEDLTKLHNGTHTIPKPPPRNPYLQQQYTTAYCTSARSYAVTLPNNAAYSKIESCVNGQKLNTTEGVQPQNRHRYVYTSRKPTAQKNLGTPHVADTGRADDLTKFHNGTHTIPKPPPRTTYLQQQYTTSYCAPNRSYAVTLPNKAPNSNSQSRVNGHKINTTEGVQPRNSHRYVCTKRKTTAQESLGTPHVANSGRADDLTKFHNGTHTIPKPPPRTPNLQQQYTTVYCTPNRSYAVILPNKAPNSNSQSRLNGQKLNTTEVALDDFVFDELSDFEDDMVPEDLIYASLKAFYPLCISPAYQHLSALQEFNELNKQYEESRRSELACQKVPFTERYTIAPSIFTNNKESLCNENDQTIDSEAKIKNELSRSVIEISLNGVQSQVIIPRTSEEGFEATMINCNPKIPYETSRESKINLPKPKTNSKENKNQQLSNKGVRREDLEDISHFTFLLKPICTPKLNQSIQSRKCFTPFQGIAVGRNIKCSECPHQGEICRVGCLTSIAH